MEGDHEHDERQAAAWFVNELDTQDSPLEADAQIVRLLSKDGHLTRLGGVRHIVLTLDTFIEIFRHFDLSIRSADGDLQDALEALGAQIGSRAGATLLSRITAYDGGPVPAVVLMANTPTMLLERLAAWDRTGGWGTYSEKELLLRSDAVAPTHTAKLKVPGTSVVVHLGFRRKNPV